jgi:anthranilate synthase/aminodeoxychorismate synthase-like glutamine amidotransferase
MILIIDNYDSFTYNIVQVVGKLGSRPLVARNDKITIDEIYKLTPEKIIISPGPCTPKESGISNDVIKVFKGKIPILGVCLGHQCIAYVFGAKIKRSIKPMHGKISFIYHDSKGIYQGLPNPFKAMRYNSLVVDEDSLPPELLISSRSQEGEIMGLRHVLYSLEGVQFHPESYKTDHGEMIIKQFLSISSG